jgi:hypothetical protein
LQATTTTGQPLAPMPSATVLAAKIDNTSGSRPRLGVDRAAVVYLEPVEGGLTRLLAVFSSAAPGGMPQEIGPIRSARESDVALLGNWGRVAFAYSGGSAYTRAIVDAGNLAAVPSDQSGEGYRRVSDRKAPYNVLARPDALVKRAGTSATTGDPGYRFGPPSPGGTSGVRVATAWPSSRVELTWDAGSGRYLVLIDGEADVDADGAPHAAATVVVQEVATHLSENRDVNGVQTPVVDLMGHGAVTVLRDGQSWKGEWSRPDLTSPTSFSAGGQPIAMASGPVWVLLVPTGQAVTVG